MKLIVQIAFGIAGGYLLVTTINVLLVPVALWLAR